MIRDLYQGLWVERARRLAFAVGLAVYKGDHCHSLTVPILFSDGYKLFFASKDVSVHRGGNSNASLALLLVILY